jgi:TPP-dependent 2-oxoacid decarboxylase
MVDSPSRRMKIGDFLLRRLEEAGVRHLFGVPGDYNLELLQQLHDTGPLKWIGTCSELNASYAADGYARLNGLGALLVTNGVGALSAINGIGGSYSEHVPVICIAGSIPLRSIDRSLGMHHTMADGTYDHFLDAYAHVTAAHTRLTPRNAATEIDRLILTAWREKLPVYMELPSDIAYLDIEVPAAPLVLANTPSDPERLHNYQAVTLKEVLKGVIDAAPQVGNRAPRPVATAMARTYAGGAHADPSPKLTQAAYWQAMQGYLREGDVLFVDNGTSYALFGLKFPPKCTFIGSVNWGSIGYSVGALLGTLTAAPERRHILFVGDGSFQVTAQELSTILRHDHKPVIFLINNGGYTIERGYLGKTEPYNDIANWSYADLPKVFRRDTSARSFVVKTESDLQDALSAPNDTMIFVESIMDQYDALAPVTNSSNKGADLNYGPRGPQHRENMQLQPAT